MDTIYALATAHGRAGVAIIRISGPHSVNVAETICGSLPKSGRALREIKSQNGEVLDQALVLTFEKGASFTGEDVVELHIHGSIAVTQAVLNLLSTFSSLRSAEPGEFTRRALENGRLDLAQVEGLADLIDAETESQRKQAMRVFSGELGQKAELWRKKLVRALALIEASIDFADEDIPEDVVPEVLSLLGEVREDLGIQISGGSFSEKIRSGFEVAILGKPNVGKSSLLNRLAGREAAITSEFAGTTRDIVEVHMDLDGLAVTFLDTAGIRQASDKVEQIGISRGLDRAKKADLRVYLSDNNDDPEIDLLDNDLHVRSKSDLFQTDEMSISAKTGNGIDGLIKTISKLLKDRVSNPGLIIRERHRVAMVESSKKIDGVVSLLNVDSHLFDLVAEELRDAVRCIDSLVGRVDVEDLLDEIFSSFCIGK